MTSTTQPAAHGVHFLCITHLEGRQLGLDWPGLSGRGHADFFQVLIETGLQPDPAVVADHSRCRFMRGGSADTSGLAFAHTSQTLRCQLNGHSIGAGQQVWLQAGDVLEIGLCRSEIKSQDLPAATVPLSSGRSAEPMTAAALALDLRDLAASQPSAIHQAPDALLDLLGSGVDHDAPPAPPARPPRPPSHAGTAPAESPRIEPVFERVADEPLSQLHERYLRRLRSPFEQHAESAWSDLMLQGEQANSDPFDQLMEEADKGPDLDHLLGQSAHINAVLVQLDTTGELGILDPDHPESLLHLFAPPEWRAPDTAQALPLLSRQEHHGVALDSAISPDALELPRLPHRQSPP